MPTGSIDSYSHISQIEIRNNQGHLHQFRVNNIGDFVPIFLTSPPECTVSTLQDVMTLTPSQRITGIVLKMDILYALSKKEYWKEVQFILNDGTT